MFMNKTLVANLEDKRIFLISDNNISFYIGIPNDSILDEYKKGAVQDLLICNRNIAYIIKNNQVIVIAGYVIVN